MLGLIWGLLPLKGFIGLVLFAALSAGIVYVWFTAVQASFFMFENSTSKDWVANISESDPKY